MSAKAPASLTFLGDPDDARRQRLAARASPADTAAPPSCDRDVFFYDPATRQNVPVCSAGADDVCDTAQDPGHAGDSSTRRGGYRVVWATRGKFANAAATDPGRARLPALRRPRADGEPEREPGRRLKLGRSVTLTTDGHARRSRGFKAEVPEGQAALVVARVAARRHAGLVHRLEDAQGQVALRRVDDLVDVDARREGHVLGPRLVLGRQEVRRRREAARCRTSPNTSKVIKITVK